MPRVAWSHLLVAPIALIALALVSCFQDVGDCPTCPAENSARIEVYAQPLRLPQDLGQPDTLRLDSILVTVDRGDTVTVRPRQRVAFSGLSPGSHSVNLVRWFTHHGSATARTTDLKVRLDRGETRTIVFHNDFPLVAWAPMPDAGQAIRRRVHGLIAPRAG